MSQPNLIKAIQDYASKIVSVPGMKVLLLDQETSGIIGLVASQSEIISKEVYLLQRIDDVEIKEEKKYEKSKQPQMHHLKAVVFVRPTPQNVDLIKQMLAKPKYKEYHLFFSNILGEESLKALAEADDYDIIRQVQEYFGDYYALNHNLFSLNLFSTRSLHRPNAYWDTKENQIFERNCSGVLSALLAMKKRPVIRFQRSSELAQRMANHLNQKMKEEGSLFLFQGNNNSVPVLLILDRRDDPVTPLLTQWTYQAMVHELLGIKNNRIDMCSVPNIRKELREVVLSPDQDHFYRGSMYLTFGDLGSSIKDLVETYQRKTKNTVKLDTIEAMQKFVESYPEFRQLSGNVSKHVAIVTELSRLIEERNLMNISELEQELACNQDHDAAKERVAKVVEDQKIHFDDKLRVVLLYCLRYENETSTIASLKRSLREKAVSDSARSRVAALDDLLHYAGSKVRGGDLFGNKSLLAKASRFLSSGLKGVENVFTQHRPLLFETLDLLIKGKLKTNTFPYLDANNNAPIKHEDIFVFIVGGTTYEEAFTVASLTESNPGTRIVLGGSCVHNSHTFLDDVLGYVEKDAVVHSVGRANRNEEIKISVSSGKQ